MLRFYLETNSSSKNVPAITQLDYDWLYVVRNPDKDTIGPGSGPSSLMPAVSLCIALCPDWDQQVKMYRSEASPGLLLRAGVSKSSREREQRDSDVFRKVSVIML